MLLLANLLCVQSVSAPTGQFWATCKLACYDRVYCFFVLRYCGKPPASTTWYPIHLSKPEHAPCGSCSDWRQIWACPAAHAPTAYATVLPHLRCRSPRQPPDLCCGDGRHGYADACRHGNEPTGSHSDETETLSCVSALHQQQPQGMRSSLTICLPPALERCACTAHLPALLRSEQAGREPSALYSGRFLHTRLSDGARPKYNGDDTWL
jgi:hypothetical protein